MHPAALEEAEMALDWYARHSTRAAEMFANDLEWATARIATPPNNQCGFAFVKTLPHGRGSEPGRGSVPGRSSVPGRGSVLSRAPQQAVFRDLG